METIMEMAKEMAKGKENINTIRGFEEPLFFYLIFKYRAAIDIISCNKSVPVF